MSEGLDFAHATALVKVSLNASQLPINGALVVKFDFVKVGLNPIGRAVLFVQAHFDFVFCSHGFGFLLQKLDRNADELIVGREVVVGKVSGNMDISAGLVGVAEHADSACKGREQVLGRGTISWLELMGLLNSQAP